MVQLLKGRCRAGDYSATVGVGPVPDAMVPVDWAPASCPNCGLVSANRFSEPRCHECGAEVTAYPDPREIIASPEGWACPECGEHALSFGAVNG
jgi:DNA-directed RNA polymerase subunit RPC12/RpoP